MTPSLVVKLTCGAEAPERANQAFTVASLAAASGTPVSLWLTGEAVWLGVPGHDFALDLATPLADLRALVLQGGRLTVCTQCAARRALTEADLIPGVRISGSASFLEEVLADGAKALVY